MFNAHVASYYINGARFYIGAAIVEAATGDEFRPAVILRNWAIEDLASAVVECAQ